jgi:hypothetical protein
MVAKGHTRASTLTSRLNARHRFITGPLIERSERSYFFRKPEIKDRAFYRDLCQSLSITMARDRLLHFQCKKTSHPIPHFSKGLR